jgi:hypothetical protein
MTRTYTCRCEKCLQTHPNGKSVGRRTHFRRMRDIRRSHSHLSRETQYECRCHEYPNGHYFFSRTSYYRHCAYLRRASSPAPSNVETSIDFSAGSIPPDDTQYYQVISLDISSDVDSLPSDDLNAGTNLDEGDDEKEQEEDSSIKLSYGISDMSDDGDTSMDDGFQNTVPEMDIESPSDDFETGKYGISTLPRIMTA